MAAGTSDVQRRDERSGRVNGIMKEHSFTHVKATFSHQEQQFHAPRSNRAADQIIFGVANIVAYRTDVPSFCSKKTIPFGVVIYREARSVSPKPTPHWKTLLQVKWL